ncbi:MAG: DNA starvation/stationary phase protection protein [Candidatus Babeliales bacterium]
MKQIKNISLFLHLILLVATTITFTQSTLNNNNNKESKIFDIGISTVNRQEISNHLNKLLANEFALFVKTNKYHWNVEGKHFGPLHALFQKQYEMIAQIIDGIAERIRSIGFKPIGTLAEFSKQMTISEEPGENPNAQEMLFNLLVDQQKIINQLRKDIGFAMEKGDAGTNNFLTELIEKHEKMAWMLRAHFPQQ